MNEELGEGVLVCIKCDKIFAAFDDDPECQECRDNGDGEEAQREE